MFISHLSHFPGHCSVALGTLTLCCRPRHPLQNFPIAPHGSSVPLPQAPAPSICPCECHPSRDLLTRKAYSVCPFVTGSRHPMSPRSLHIAVSLRTPFLCKAEGCHTHSCPLRCMPAPRGCAFRLLPPPAAGGSAVTDTGRIPNIPSGRQRP